MTTKKETPENKLLKFNPWPEPVEEHEPMQMFGEKFKKGEPLQMWNRSFKEGEPMDLWGSEVERPSKNEIKGKVK